MTPLLAPVQSPRHPLLKLGYFFTRRSFGKVPGPLSVFCARMPFAFTSFYGRVGWLDRKLTLPSGTAMLIRQQVARGNSCLYCMDANRAAAIRKSEANRVKQDELDDYRDSSLFTDPERAALNYAAEVTQDRKVSDTTFAELSRHYNERQICEIVWLIASEHLYNLNNVALNIGSDGYCEIQDRTQPT
jgi:alkylhydroperoxidase family enzyme